jgi:anti-sigma factor RsiW
MNVKMNDADFQNLKEINWRRRLTAVEEEKLNQLIARHPELQERWEQEAALGRLLQRLPAAPVSSNFTSRVLQAVQRAPTRRQRPGWRLWLPSGWMPRAALALAMAGCGLFSFREYQLVHRAQVAREVAGASRLASLPPVEWLKDFETIDRLNKVKVADDDLLIALQ